MIKITDIREVAVPLQGKISNAVVNFSEHDVSLVALITNQQRNGKAVVGYGFNSIGRFAQSGIIRQRLMPRLLSADPASLVNSEGTLDPARVAATALRNEKPGGHGDRASAVAALELAVWDLNAKLLDEPASHTIARSAGLDAPAPAVSTYAAGGYYYSEDSTERLRQELTGYQELGFDAFKIKIGGASLDEDLARIDTALELTGAGGKLAVDANGRFDLETAVKYSKSLSGQGLRWLEEPGDPLDFELVRELTAISATPIATGENLFSRQDAANLVRYAGMRGSQDIFQMDAGLSYGLTEYMHIVADLEAAGFDRIQCVPHGGHLINLHIVAGLHLGGCEAYPGVFSPFGGFSSACRLDMGQVSVSDAPGFGLEEKHELQPILQSLIS